MSTEIVIPKNNEPEFVEIAEKLGIKKICFLYDVNNYDKAQGKISSIEQKTDVQIETGVLVNTKHLNKIPKAKIIAAKSSEKDRSLIESKKVNMIFGFEEIPRKDYLHQRASGLNGILCQLAKENNITLGFSYGSLFDKSPQQRSIIIGRMSQNLVLCKKYKTKIIAASFSDNPYDLRSNHDVAQFFGLIK